MSSAKNSVPKQDDELSPEAESLRLFIFFTANASLMLLYLAFWFVGYRIQWLGDLGDSLGSFQFAIWFTSFFLVSALVLGPLMKRWVFIKCLGIASGCAFLTFCLFMVSMALLAPFLDPHW